MAATADGELESTLTIGTNSGSKGRYIVLKGASASTGPVTVVVHYKLKAFRTSDSTWQYWTDASVSLASAPGGAVNYNAATLTEEGSW